jgi:hypothetical protein
MPSTTDLDAAIQRLDIGAQRSDLSGPDPYDGLSSPYFRSLGRLRTRQVAVQLVKRAPRGTREVLRMTPVRMTKALSLFLRGYLRAQRWQPLWAERVPGLIADIASRQRPQGGWGYEFDVQTRWAFYPAGSPNIVVTSFAIEALSAADALEHVSEQTWRWLGQEMITDSGYVRYVPDSDKLIHNANLLGSRALVRSGNQDLITLAASAIDHTLDRQRPDGSWAYGEGSGLGWIDNFHSVYVLSCLLDLGHVRPTGEAFARGIRFWGDTFMRSVPARYFPGSAGRVDLHNLSTALLPFSWPEADLSATARDAHVRSLLGFQRRDGLLRTRPWAPSYMRWSNAHAFDALTAVREAHG